MAYRRTRLMEERLAGNRERILRATRRLIAEGGFRNAQIAAVAAQAEVSTGTIYRYFPSKAELFVEVLTAAVDHEIDILREVIASRSTARGQLEAAVASALALNDEACANMRAEARRFFLENDLVFRSRLVDAVRGLAGAPDARPVLPASIPDERWPVGVEARSAEI